MIVFFFSSRRRHTIFDCDWSSDVCSSDLAGVERRPGPLNGLRRKARILDRVVTALERELFPCPHSLQDREELFGAGISLVVLHPCAAVLVTFGLPPRAHHVESEAAVRDPIDRRSLLCDERRKSEVRPDRGHELEPLRSEEHTSELQSQSNLVCRLLLE